MKVSKEWNNVSPQAISALKLSKSKPITIKMAGINYDEHGVPSVPRYRRIPSADRITDPSSGESVSIAYIENFAADGTPKLGLIAFRSDDKGFKTFNPKSIKDVETLEFLLLTDYNGSKKGRDTSKKIWFTVYEPEKIASDNVRLSIAKADAVILVGQMTNLEIKGFAAAKGWGETDHRLIRRKMIDWANKDHESFLAFTDDKTIRVNAVLRNAESEGLLNFDGIANEWQWKSSGETIHAFQRKEGFDRYSAFKEWMLTSDVAVKIIDDLEVQLGLAAPKKITPKASPKVSAKK